MVITKPVKLPLSKRAFDVAVSIFVLIITAPMAFIFLILITIEHILIGQPLAPLFYSEERYSNGKPFMLVKFNIFNPRVIKNLKQQGEFIHTKEIEHMSNGLINVGMVLKKIYLDELPQFFNILSGKISLVGPRPVNKEVYEGQLSKGNMTRKFMKAGLTGNFQVMKGDPNSKSEELDNYYMEYCASQPWWKILWLDVRICIRTILFILKAEGI